MGRHLSVKAAAWHRLFLSEASLWLPAMAEIQQCGLSLSPRGLGAGLSQAVLKNRDMLLQPLGRAAARRAGEASVTAPALRRAAQINEPLQSVVSRKSAAVARGSQHSSGCSRVVWGRVCTALLALAAQCGGMLDCSSPGWGAWGAFLPGGGSTDRARSPSLDPAPRALTQQAHC